ncbi:uncharacterized protein LOC124372162 [Homalodisca vitripennis]|uniref:uncharacterized protein LOC124372162 n=1 Tax=Homalodisca vitripennis TaxID=197043 RepID=UPI001EEC5919|nr:uncharacterized protein LOC124372162 [Homalodisca vitripennis]
MSGARSHPRGPSVRSDGPRTPAVTRSSAGENSLERTGTDDNAPSGAAGEPIRTIYDYPWTPCMYQLCTNFFTRARDLVDHHKGRHPATELRIRCRKCGGDRFTGWNGITIHYSKCRGPSAAPPSPHCCPECERRFTTKSGLTIHGNSSHPERRNVERLAAREPPPPAPRAPWTADENAVLCRRYHTFRRGGRVQGYGVYIAEGLPGRTDKQVRDRVRTLLKHGRLPVPDSSGESGEDSDLGAGGRAPIPGPSHHAGAQGHRAPESSNSGASDNDDDNLPDCDLPDETPDMTALPDDDPPDDDEPPDDDPPETRQNLDETSDVTPDLTPRTKTPPIETPPAETPLTPTTRSPLTSEAPDAAAADVDGSPVFRAPAPVPGGSPPGDPPPDDPPPEDPDGGTDDPHDAVWTAVLAHLHQITPVCEIGRRLQQLAAVEGDIGEELNNLVVELHRAFVAAAPDEDRRRSGRSNLTARDERTRRRITRYARTQELWKRTPSRLAEMVLKDNLGDLSSNEPRAEPPREATIDLYRSLWGTASDCVPDLQEKDPRRDGDVNPFTSVEVLKGIKRLKPGGAPGLDGVTKRGITNYPQAAGTLAVLFNIVLFRGAYPAAWQQNRTTLIPKRGKDLHCAANWRPITIAPLAARIFSSAVERRILGQVTLAERQRGFRPGNGCHMNCLLLDQAVRLGKRIRLVGVLLDVSKAFDTVSHVAIQRVLRSHGVSRCLSDIMGRMYAGGTTTLGTLGSGSHGFTIGRERLAATAYADDVTLLADSMDGMREMLATTSEYLASVGLELSAAKSGGFCVERSGDAWVSVPLRLCIQGQPVRTFGVAEPFQYLGLTFTIQHGLRNRQHLDSLLEAASRVRRLSLKPQQKVQLLMQYIVPTFAHRLTIDLPSSVDLDRVDTALWKEVKDILHLLDCTTDGVLYSRKRDGGLGFPRLGVQLKICALRACLGMLSTGDALISEMSREAD